ncbi:MAG: hypothetical protein COW03_16900 [Cytophagales bacterium CG12_big_fil_rev_8_21_14_0_65_40_12]|nr:MAG: hypothetical protein COW03_16900 [Cytophagales bacterium CG12_big_fil_rev_8_21_14_0_65_40_12]PIW04512.1 MAG: hypothetical protein COW40_09465 [Cytophagales bacterium CG17_big_fil_post_rev_8_21_14_2_50_40_13]
MKKSTFHEKIEYHTANEGWLNMSFEISLEILNALESKDWNQTMLATKLGVSRQQVSKYLNGQNDFKISTIAKLESVLDIKLIAVVDSSELVLQKQHINQDENNVSRQ